ncbi:hypothetical protein ASG68_03900 [Rhizobium sp. Leaf453]|nr:hypothetical protein ASG50_08030 [Rhizobium sp. Leaf386]KQS91211.1 hypothetical protein ASG42_09250 [Rhizobium sp. Leaf391]KQU10357.1 hypothetical protein ASG68_03900 [Rhizobium sp. Leaf453]
MLTEEKYNTLLQSILMVHTQPALSQLNAIKQSLPKQARQFEIGIHPGQDGEGFFDVVVHLDGPDLYVLNKAIQPYRVLFSVKCIDGRMQPDVPMFDPGETLFCVNDVIVDVCMTWVEKLWSQSGGVGLPGYVFGEEGYGTISRKPLLP